MMPPEPLSKEDKRMIAAGVMGGITGLGIVVWLWIRAVVNP